LDVIEEYASGKTRGDEDVHKSCVSPSFRLCQSLRDEYVKITMVFKNGVSVLRWWIRKLSLWGLNDYGRHAMKMFWIK